MSEFNEGDLVEAVKGERRVIDRVLRDDEGDLHIRGAGYLTNANCLEGVLFANGYVVTVIERVPALPTEPGWYTDVQGDIWKLLDGGRYWRRMDIDAMEPEKALHYAPFTRLEPVAETAARFVARLHAVVQPKIDRDWYTKATAKAILKQADALAAEFGVTGGLGVQS